jgi:hypothetical protein
MLAASTLIDVSNLNSVVVAVVQASVFHYRKLLFELLHVLHIGDVVDDN